MCIHVVHLVHILKSEKTLKDVGHYVIVRLNIYFLMNEFIYLTFVYPGESTELLICNGDL